MKNIIISLLVIFSSLLTNGQKVSGNCYNGYGVYEFSNGTYSGYWKNGNRSGIGTYRFSNGNIYEGHFLNGKYDGKGSYTWNDGDSKKTGVWKNGEVTEEMEIVHQEYKSFYSNATKESNSDDPDDFNTFEKYFSSDYKFKLYEDKVVLDGQPYEIDRIISESGIFSKTIHIALVPYPESTGSLAHYFHRCSEMIVDYDSSGEIESIKTNHYLEAGQSNRYFWWKHVKVSSFQIKPSETIESKSVKW